MKPRPLLAFVALAGTCLAHGQSSVPSSAPVQAIVGARIEMGDGRVVEKGTLVMRDGLIAAVGADVAIPPGAEILDGTGLTVYPGFIEGYTNKGVKLPDPVVVKTDTPPYSDYTPAFMPEENRKGIHPDTLASQVFQPTDDILKSYRNAGFTSALVVPTGYIGGRAALINLGDGSGAHETIRPNIAMGFAFGGVSGDGYPGSLLGVVAQIRQALADAASYPARERAYERGPASRPVFDDGLAVLAASTSGPSLFPVNSAAEIDRVLEMSAEFNLKPVVVGGSEAWRRVEEIQTHSIPVVVGLSFGDEPKAPEAPKAGEDGKVPDPDPDQDTPERFAEKKRLFLEKVNNAKILASHNVPVAFSTDGTKSVTEFMDNLRRAVKEGLPRELALRGLTSNAASMFGVSGKLGTLDVGKIADVTVMTGDFLDEKSKVKMVYIDGDRFDPGDSGAPPPGPRRRRPSDDEGHQS